MTSAIAGIIALYAFISLAAQLFILWLVDISSFNIRESYGNYKPYGILILVSFIIIFIIFQKHLLRQNRETSIWKLILASTVLSFIAVILYQTIRQLVILRGQYDYDFTTVLRTTLVVTVVTALVAASVAVEIKKVKAIWRYMPSVIALGMLLMVKEYLRDIDW